MLYGYLFVMEGYIGEIRLFPKDWVPNGWLVCDGREVRFKDYDILSVICGVNGLKVIGVVKMWTLN